MKILNIEAHSNVDILPAVKYNINQIKFKKIGLFTTVQHIKQIDTVKEFLENKGISVFTGKSQKTDNQQGPKATYCGQILGCDASAAKSMKVDAFLYIGTGLFHPLAISLETNKPVFRVNPHTKIMEKVSELERRKWLAKQAARVSKIQDAKKIGIILSTKPGQYKPKLAEKLNKKFKNSYVFITDMITPHALLDFIDIDVWVNTACPRLVEDSWPKPFVNANDII